MTDLDAVTLAVFGYPRRRLLGALMRHWLARPLPDLDDLPVPDGAESFVRWAARCVAGPEGDADAELRQAGQIARRALVAGRALGQRPVSIGATEYPAALREIPDPPPLLWLRGRIEALHEARLVAVVGARAASRQGLEVAMAIGGGLAAAGVVVVSGLARGVDTAAHRAAIDAGGRSVAVLGSGLDRIYPPEHALLADALIERGALVSEYLPGTPPLSYHFPLRNRIISGLTAATVVVEASEKSGSLITAGAALEQGREVMAVPGSVATGRHRGAHALLRDGATLVERAEDVLAALGWASPDATPGAPAGPALDPALAAELGLPPGTDDFGPDDVAAGTGWTLAEVGARLGVLEISGRISRIAGGRFVGSRNRVLT
ncbi:MAG: DNA-processing protein DprA [Vicinamibacterales bacterium]